MKYFKIALLLAVVGFGSQSFAACSINMNYNQLVDCIVDYGASDDYTETVTENKQSANSNNTK